MNKWVLALALLTLLTACAAPTPDSQAGLDALQSGDYQTALEIWEPLAEQGDANAQTNLGTMYSKGDGVPQDDVKAAEWFRKAAEQGYPAGQHYLGFMYASGKGVPLDYVSAYAWFALAAAQEYPNSSQSLAFVEEKMSEFEIQSAQNLAQEYYDKYLPPAP